MSGETFTVVLSPVAFATLCGLVQPNEVVYSPGIYSEAWDELCRVFPVEGFHAAVAAEEIEYDPEAGT